MYEKEFKNIERESSQNNGEAGLRHVSHYLKNIVDDENCTTPKDQTQTNEKGVTY